MPLILQLWKVWGVQHLVIQERIKHIHFPMKQFILKFNYGELEVVGRIIPVHLVEMVVIQNQ